MCASVVHTNLSHVYASSSLEYEIKDDCCERVKLSQDDCKQTYFVHKDLKWNENESVKVCHSMRMKVLKVYILRKHGKYLNGHILKALLPLPPNTEEPKHPEDMAANRGLLGKRKHLFLFPRGSPKPRNGASQTCTGYFAGASLRKTVLGCKEFWIWQSTPFLACILEHLPPPWQTLMTSRALPTFQAACSLNCA